MEALESIPSYSLVIIDEIEASLHPRAQRRLIHFLLWLARTKQLQVILSTHSPIVLDELPPEARIFVQRGAAGIDVIHGVSTALAINRMDMPGHFDVTIFVEDGRASVLAREILRKCKVDLGQVRILPAGSSEVVAVLGQMAVTKRLPFACVCVVDGDASASRNVVTIPGPSMAPEKAVFAGCKDSAIAHLAARFSETDASVRDKLVRSMSLLDHHLWIDDFSTALGRDSQAVWESMCETWVATCLAATDRDTFVSDLERLSGVKLH